MFKRIENFHRLNIISSTKEIYSKSNLYSIAFQKFQYILNKVRFFSHVIMAYTAFFLFVDIKSNIIAKKIPQHKKIWIHHKLYHILYTQTQCTRLKVWGESRKAYKECSHQKFWKNTFSAPLECDQRNDTRTENQRFGLRPRVATPFRKSRSFFWFNRDSDRNRNQISKCVSFSSDP